MKNIKKLKDPGSAITHFIGMIMALFAATPLLIRATHEPDTIHVVSLAVFIVSMILLYAASTAYHSFNLSARANLILKKIDHMMIFVLIAGTYTPMCLIVLHGRTGYILLATVWGIAIAGNMSKVVLINTLYCNGMGMRACIHTDTQFPLTCCFWVASCRRHYLYRRWYYIRPQASDIQRKA